MKARQELHAFHFLMAWHPRLNTDPRHVWLRDAELSSFQFMSLADFTAMVTSG